MPGIRLGSAARSTRRSNSLFMPTTCCKPHAASNIRAFAHKARSYAVTAAYNLRVDRKILITGASGFIGGAISHRLIGRDEIRSLTSHPEKNRFGERVQSFAYDFDAPMRMEEAFRGVDVFVNSYYVRFNYGRA